MLLELGPFCVGGFAILFSRADGSPAVEESSVRVNKLFVEPSGVTLCCHQSVVPENLRGDVDRQATGDHLGGEHAPKVVRGGLDRLTGDVAHTHPLPCLRQQLVDHPGDDDLGLVVAIALEQMRQRD